MKHVIRTLAIGSQVHIGEDVPGITGKITAISIRGAQANYVSYEVIFWVGGERKELWLQPWEVSPVDEVEAATIETGVQS